MPSEVREEEEDEEEEEEKSMISTKMSSILVGTAKDATPIAIILGISTIAYQCNDLITCTH